MGLTLEPFCPADQPAAKALILAGLVDHWGFLDESKNPDLNDIAATYAGAVFLVAREGERLVGTGALVQRSPGRAEIVRMSVARDSRRRGIGSRVLQALLHQARQLGYHSVFLETTAAWQDVIDFYLHHGFRITHYQNGDVYFELALKPAIEPAIEPAIKPVEVQDEMGIHERKYV